MFSDSLKVSFLRINQIKLIFVQFEKFLRFKVFLFHVLICLWHLWLNFHIFLAARYLFLKRWDIVEQTCGFGSQYITIWNQIIHQSYFSTTVVVDIWEAKFRNKWLPIRMCLKRILPFWFTSLVFPMSFVVAINFWTFYTIRREGVDENNVMALYMPGWVNHGLHTSIVAVVCMEKVLVRHTYPRRIWSFLGISALLVLYAAMCTVLYLGSGMWPYPIVRDMTTVEKISAVVGNCLLGSIFVELGELINKKVWDTKAMKSVAGAKVEKVS